MIGRPMLEVAGTLHRRHHDRDGAVGLLAAVQQPQRLGDPPRILVVLNGYRLLVEVRLRVLGGVLAVGHRDGAEVAAGRAGQMHVPLRDHGHLRRRRRKPVRVRERIVSRRRIRLRANASHETGLHLAEPHAGPLVERPVRDDDVGHPGRHRHRGVLNGRARGATAIVDLGEELQLTDTRSACHGDLGVGVHREGGEPVDIGRAQSGVVEGVKHRLGRQPQLAATGVLREVGGPDADDGSLTRQHQAPPIVSVLVAMT